MKIKITKEVTFKDRSGAVVAFYPVGAIIEASGKTSTYFITPMGGIYFDEAEEVSQ